nr:MAG TPA: hypothetical protein [Caudoviricetes sp.]
MMVKSFWVKWAASFTGRPLFYACIEFYPYVTINPNCYFTTPLKGTQHGRRTDIRTIHSNC